MHDMDNKHVPLLDFICEICFLLHDCDIHRFCSFMQSRRLEVRLRTTKPPTGEAKKDYVHMLNCTLSATERTLCCILENYQTAEGVRYDCMKLPAQNVIVAAFTSVLSQ